MSQAKQLALSLAETMERLSGSGGTNLQTAWGALLGVDPTSPDLYLGVTVVYRKFIELVALISKSTISDRAKGLYLGAVGQLMPFTIPGNLSSFSSGSVLEKKDKIDLLHLAADALPGGLVADVQPATLEALCTELVEILRSVAEADIEPEICRLIQTSLETLLMVLRSYKVFGADGAARIYGSVVAELARSAQQDPPKSEPARSLLQRTIGFAKKVGAVVIWTSALAGGVENLITDGTDIASMLTGNDDQTNEAAKPAADKVIADVVEKWGKIEILVNNAGIIRDGLLATMDAQQWQDVIDTNLTSVFNFCQAATRQMMSQRYGRIINMSSVAADVSNPGQANYAASKGGVEGFTRCVATELARRGVTANAVAPGFIETDMTVAVVNAAGDEIKKKIPVRRLGRPDDISNAVLFFAADESSYVTGQILKVDGGLTLGGL